MSGLERRVRPRIEKESDLDAEASSDAAQSSESEDDNSREVPGSDGGDSDSVSILISQFP